MTKEYLLNQLKNLEAQRNELQANANACQGAILFCQQCLAELERPKDVPADKPTPKLPEQGPGVDAAKQTARAHYDEVYAKK